MRFTASTSSSRCREESRATVASSSGTEPQGPRDHRRAARHRLDHHEAERLRPVDGEQQRAGAAEEGGLADVLDLPDEFDERIVEERRDDALDVLAIVCVDLGGDAQRHAHALGHLDGDLGLLLRRQPAEERQVLAGLGHERRPVERIP